MAAQHISGTDGHVSVRIVTKKRRCKRCLPRNAKFTLNLVPNDRSRWVVMTVNGTATRGRQGTAGPVL